jgi:two-component system, chemotaxis family, response regulator Rcp1
VTEADQKRLRVVLAEDNPADVFLVREALNQHRIECDLRVLADGAQAIEFLNQLDSKPSTRQLDLFLLDMHLPKYDGLDILKRLRATESHAQTPVIVMTSSHATWEREAAEKHAALYYFEKPSDYRQFMELGHLVQQVLGK